MWGLNDAPLAFQLALAHYYVGERHAIQSSFDECFFFWLESPGVVNALATSHVDDNGMGASPEWLNHEFQKFTRRFGGATKHGLPFTHTGVHYSDSDRGRKMDQDELCQKLKPHAFTKERAKQENSDCTPAAITSLRGLLGGLMWLCQTRLDLVGDVVLQQQDITKATASMIKAANALITKAKKYGENCGLHFPRLKPPLKLGEVCDASHASRSTSYAQEGVIILLMPDRHMQVIRSDSPHYKALQDGEGELSTFCHVLAQLAHKAKRISSSTSLAETLAAVLGQEMCQLVALRLTEILGAGIQLPMHTASPLNLLKKSQESGDWCIPIDHFTHCRDLFQLSVGEKGVPQDRHQRLYILSIREDRIKGAIRHFWWIPTSGMVSDALTKPMISPIMYDLITHGFWRVWCVGPKGETLMPLVAPALHPMTDYAEQDLIEIQKKLPKDQFHMQPTNNSPTNTVHLVAPHRDENKICMIFKQPTRRKPSPSASSSESTPPWRQRWERHVRPRRGPSSKVAGPGLVPGSAPRARTGIGARVRPPSAGKPSVAGNHVNRKLPPLHVKIEDAKEFQDTLTQENFAGLIKA